MSPHPTCELGKRTHVHHVPAEQQRAYLFSALLAVALLFCEVRSLPLGKPSVWVWWGPRVFHIMPLGQPHPARHELPRQKGLADQTPGGKCRSGAMADPCVTWAATGGAHDERRVLKVTQDLGRDPAEHWPPFITEGGAVHCLCRCQVVPSWLQPLASSAQAQTAPARDGGRRSRHLA